MPKKRPPLTLGEAVNTDSVATLVSELLSRFPERVQEILAARFGMTGQSEATLEKIGRQHGITRERVRQIVDAAVRSMKRALAVHTEAPLVKKIEMTVAAHHGAVSLTTLLDELGGKLKTERAGLMLLVLSHPGLKLLKKNAERQESIALLNFSPTEWSRVVKAAQAVFQERNEALTLTELHPLVVARLDQAAVAPAVLASYLKISQSIASNVFDQFGFAEWSAIHPRGTRERAFLVLKMHGQPLHFRAIAKLIDEQGLSRGGRTTHPQTVHNELIKDKRFVLVGRGTYALAAWGYQRGTVREVIADIIRGQAAPMTREALLQAVMKVRQVKKSTIIINLNSFFTKVGKNVYTLKEGK